MHTHIFIHTRHSNYRPHYQRGAVLIVSMLILLVMTIIGVTAMQSTTLEEKMAGNMRERNTAFQSAESALREGEQEVENLFSIGAFTSDCSTYKHVAKTDLSCTPAFNEYDATTWSGSRSKAYTGASLGSGVPNPRFFIQIVADLEGGGPKDPTLGGYSEKGTGGQVKAFRIVARGTGVSGTSSVLIESTYGKLF